MNPQLLAAQLDGNSPAWTQTVLAFLAEKERRSGSQRRWSSPNEQVLELPRFRRGDHCRFCHLRRAVVSPATRNVVPAAAIPLIYAAAMAVDAASAFATGWLYDHIGRKSLITVPVLTAAIPLLAFQSSPALAIAGIQSRASAIMKSETHSDKKGRKMIDKVVKTDEEWRKELTPEQRIKLEEMRKHFRERAERVRGEFREQDRPERS